MKKLMVTAAAALCATVGFSSIESANVVGYATNCLKNGASIATSQFKNIVAGGFALNDIKPSNYGVSLYTVDEFGVPQTTYLWTDCGGEDWDTPDVWVDMETNLIVTDVKFGSGDGLFILGTDDLDEMTTAGEVMKDDVTIQLCNGATLVGNPFPVDSKLNDVVVNNYGISLYEVDEFGVPQTTYLWTDCGGEDWDTPDVWVDMETNLLVGNDVLIKAGEGVFVLGTSEEDTITFAAPEF